MNRIAVVLTLIFLSTGLMPGSASAEYKEVRVEKGGSLKGRVFLDGPKPPARVYHLVFSPNSDFCTSISDGSGNRYLQEYKTSKDGGFQDVVVAIVGVKEGKPFNLNPIMWLEDCQIRPFVTAVRNNHAITIASNDPVQHNIQGYTLDDDYTFQMFHKLVPEKASVQKKIKFRPGHYIFRTQCGMHDFMQSWGIAVGNPYFAVTDKNGDYEIRNVPPGNYHVLAWHPNMEIQAHEITILPNGQVEKGFIFNASEVHIPAHDLQTSYRLQPWVEELTGAVTEHPDVKLQVHEAPDQLSKPMTWQERSEYYLVNPSPK